MVDVASGLSRVRERISAACTRCGRSSDDVTLIAVSKTVPSGLVLSAIAAGATDLGENYVQEALAKQDEIAANVRWHFIGHLQRNKARHVVGRFELVHGVDGLELAAELGRRAVARGSVQSVLIEVKLDPSDTKAGVAPSSALDLAGTVADVPGLRLQGFMGMPPFGLDEAAVRPYFRTLRRLFDALPAEYRAHLSMGMTADFEVAIEEGATMVRVGTAIFGARA